MKKSMIKLIILSLVMVVLLLPFAACSSNGDTSNETEKTTATATTTKTATTTTTTTTAATSEALELAKVVFWSAWDFPKDVDMVLGKIEEVTRDTLNIDLVFNSAPAGEYANKLNLLFAAGDDFDYLMDGEWLGSNERILKGYYYDLTELAPKYAPNWINRLSDDELDTLKYEGRLLSLGWKYPKSGRPVFVIRKDFAEKYNITDVKDFDDVEKVLKTIKENEDITPMVFHPIPIGAAEPLKYIFQGAAREYFYAASGSLGVLYHLDSPEKLFMEYDAEGIEELLEMMHRWYENGYLDQNILNVKDSPPDLVKGGRAASYFHVYDALGTNNRLIAAALPESGGLAGWSMFPDQRAEAVPPTNNMYSLNRNSQNPERTLMFLNWILDSQDNFDLMLYGIEGVHYELENEKIKMPEGVTAATNGWVGWRAQWPLWDLEHFRWNVLDADEYIDGYEYGSTHNAVVLPLSGFTFVPTNAQKTIIAKYSALRSELWIPLVFGVASPERLSDFKKQADAIGMPELLADMQAQVEEFLANK